MKQYNDFPLSLEEWIHIFESDVKYNRDEPFKLDVAAKRGILKLLEELKERRDKDEEDTKLAD